MTTNYVYRPEQKQLILLNPKGKPVLSIAGTIGNKVYDRINQKNRTTMKMNAKALELKIESLNDWLRYNENHKDYKEKHQNRNYYVSKLIELEESGLEKIEV